MSPDKENFLFTNFSFFQPERPLGESSMAYGFECNNGWYDLIYKLCLDLESILERTKDSWQFEVLQVKEKFGTLRFYTNWETEEILERIDEAKRESTITCELCGDVGTLCTRGSWYKTLCPECAFDEGYEGIKISND